MTSFQATTDFDSSLREVDVLLSLAVEKDSDAVAFSSLLKSSILLLTAKLEAFLEEVAEECRFRVEQAECAAEKIPDSMKVAILQSFFDESFLSKLRQGNAQVLERVASLSGVISGGPIGVLEVETKFSYGRHGENEVRKLFQRLGVSDIVAQSYHEDGEAGAASFRADLNSLIAIRNNIIHSDASPSFSVDQVKGFVDRMRDFSTRIDQCLERHCEGIVG